MLTKERERLARAARDLHGSALIEKIKAWKRGELDDSALARECDAAVGGVKALTAVFDDGQKPAAKKEAAP